VVDPEEDDRMKVSELNGALLDYWVAKCEGAGGSIGPRVAEYTDGNTYCLIGGNHPRIYSPTGSWDISGPIVERDKIALVPEGAEWVALWQPESWPAGVLSCDGPVATALHPRTAAMRCYLMAKLGRDIPDEWTPQT
jgi:hypothetical protein